MDSLEKVADEIAICENCPLNQGRTNTVPGQGRSDADIMFIGEGPGFHEDRQGLPFVGASGKFLAEMLGSIGLTREDVFITNVVKCRPPGNRDPQSNEIDACREYLDRQIELINPKVIITLGRFSMARYFPDARISKIHGQAKKIGNRLYIPMYHPAAALHQPSLRTTVQADFARIPELIEQMASASGEEQSPDEPEQLSLF